MEVCISIVILIIYFIMWCAMKVSSVLSNDDDIFDKNLRL